MRFTGCCAEPGLPDVFQTKIPNLGKFFRALDWKMLIYFMAVCNILWTFGKFYEHLVHFVLIWYIFSSFGITYQEKSANPVTDQTHCPRGKNYIFGANFM
jgi:hypothetical protein